MTKSWTKELPASGGIPVTEQTRRSGRTLIVAVALVAAACGSSDTSNESPTPSTPTAPVPTTTTSTSTTTTSTTTTTMPPALPTDIVAAFYDAWRAGDVDAAIGHTTADFTSTVGDRGLTTSFLDYVVAVGQSVTQSDCTSVRNGPSDIVTCTVEQRDPVVEALDLRAPRVKHTITDGLLTKIAFGTTYASADAALGSFAREVDPVGYSDACQAATNGSALVGNEVEYSGACGAFLAGIAADAAVQLLADGEAGEPVDPISVVTGFYEAWDAGDIEAAAAFLSPQVTSPAGAQEGPGLVRLRNFMEYTKAVSQSVTATDCELQSLTLVFCRVEYRDPLIDALGITGSRALHEVAGGLLTFVTLSGQYAQSDAALIKYVKEASGEDYADACTVPDDGSVWAELGLAYNATCGEFVAQFVDDAAS